MTTELYLEIEITPVFHEIDAMEVVWHGHYFKYMEQARSALLQRCNYDYPQMRESGYFWPVVDARIKYVRPLRYGQRVRIETRVVEWENRLKFDYRFVDAETGEKLTTAHTIQVAVAAANGEMQYLCPTILWQRLGVPAP